MASPDFSAVRNEISDLFDGLVPTYAALNVPFLPLTLGGLSPIISTEDDGWRSLLAAMNPGQFDLGYRITIRVNRSVHGAANAQDRFDELRERIINIVTNPALVVTNFEALEIPSGAVGDTFLEVEDGQQYITGFVPVNALNVVCG